MGPAEERPAGGGFWKLSGGRCQALCGFSAESSPIGHSQQPCQAQGMWWKGDCESA